MTTNASVGIVTPRKIPFDTPLALENGKTLPRFDLMPLLFLFQAKEEVQSTKKGFFARLFGG